MRTSVARRSLSIRRSPRKSLPGGQILAKPVVFIVDDYQPLRESFMALFASAGLESRGYASAQKFLADYRPGQCGCLILDLQLGEMSGLELQAQLRERKIGLPIIFLSGHGDIPCAVQAIQCGAVDFLEKPVRDEVLLQCVRKAIDRDSQTRRADGEREEILARLDKLSARERQILDLVAEGHTNKTMASELGLAAKTIEFHRAKMMAKMQASGVAELIRMVLKVGPTGGADAGTQPAKDP
jgi:two-component system response regulator FixJ